MGGVVLDVVGAGMVGVGEGTGADVQANKPASTTTPTISTIGLK